MAETKPDRLAALERRLGEVALLRERTGDLLQTLAGALSFQATREAHSLGVGAGDEELLQQLRMLARKEVAGELGQHLALAAGKERLALRAQPIKHLRAAGAPAAQAGSFDQLLCGERFEMTSRRLARHIDSGFELGERRLAAALQKLEERPLAGAEPGAVEIIHRHTLPSATSSCQVCYTDNAVN
jgi:hypothetical protein